MSNASRALSCLNYIQSLCALGCSLFDSIKLLTLFTASTSTPSSPSKLKLEEKSSKEEQCAAVVETLDHENQVDDEITEIMMGSSPDSNLNNRLDI